MKYKNGLIRLFIGLVFLSGFIIYYYGYEVEASVIKFKVDVINELARIFFALFSSAAMFTLNNGLSAIRSDLTNDPFYLVVFWSVHSMAILATFATFFLIFQYKIFNYLKLKSAIHKRRYFLWGADEEVLVLIQNIRLQEKCPHEITILLNEKTDVFIEQLERLKVTYAYMSSDVQKFITKLNMKKILAHDNYFILMQNNYDENIRMAIDLLKIPHIRGNGKFHLIVNCDNEEWSADLLSDTVVNLKTYHLADLMARHFIQTYPPYSQVEADTAKASIKKDYHVIIIGFGDYGEQILLKLISQGQFYNRSFKATVIEQSYNQNIGKFKRLYGNLIEKYKIDFHHLDFDSDAFNQIIESSVNTLSAIIICTDDDQVNKRVGIEINQFLKNVEASAQTFMIYVKNAMPSAYIKKMHEDVNNYKNLAFFGAIDEVLSPEILINEKLDLLAESIHDFYRIRSNGTMVEWKQLTPFLKDSNRNAALHIFTKLGLVGLKVMPASDVKESDRIIDSKKALINHIGSQRMKMLAKHEHLRWCAFHHIHGWKHQAIIDGEPIKNNRLKTHGCLVSWEELDVVSSQTGQDYQASCMNQIDNIYDYLKSIHYVISEESK